MRRCENQEQLSAYLDQELDGQERKALEKHLAGCDTCQRELRELKRVSALVAGLPRLTAPAVLAQRVAQAVRHPQPAEKRIVWIRMIWPAAAAALFAAVLYFASPHESGPEPLVFRAPAPDAPPEPAPPAKETWLAAAPEPPAREAVAEAVPAAPKEEDDFAALPAGRARSAGPFGVVSSAPPAEAAAASVAALAEKPAAKSAVAAAPAGLAQAPANALDGRAPAAPRPLVERLYYRISVDDVAGGREEVAALVKTWEGVATSVSVSGHDRIVVRCVRAHHETLARRLREKGYVVSPPLGSNRMARLTTTEPLARKEVAVMATATRAPAPLADAAKPAAEKAATPGADPALMAKDTAERAKAQAQEAKTAAPSKEELGREEAVVAEAGASLNAKAEMVEVVLILAPRQAPAGE